MGAVVSLAEKRKPAKDAFAEVSIKELAARVLTRKAIVAQLRALLADAEACKLTGFAYAATGADSHYDWSGAVGEDLEKMVGTLHAHLWVETTPVA